MSVLIDRSTKLLVQGATGRDGSFHTKAMKDYGTDVVAGVTPGKGGTEVAGVPVFDTVRQAVRATGANASCIFVPAPFCGDAILEAVDGGLSVVVAITEGVPVADMTAARDAARAKGCVLIGPNCPGLISPGRAKVGIIPGHICKEGRVGVVSRSGTLTYEVIDHLTKAGLGQSTAIGIGGDPVIGTGFNDALRLFKEDEQTEGVVLLGEIGGAAEERAAEYIAQEFNKPVVAFIAGRTAPPEKRMGHAGAIVSGGEGTAAEKIAALERAGVPVADVPAELPGLLGERI